MHNIIYKYLSNKKLIGVFHVMDFTCFSVGKNQAKL